MAASRGGAPREQGWLFTGRRAVLRQIVTWMHAETPGIFVVTGSAGCGKSAVVGRIAALSDPAERRVLLEHVPPAAKDQDPQSGAVELRCTCEDGFRRAGEFLYARIVASQIARQVVDVNVKGWQQRLPREGGWVGACRHGACGRPCSRR